MKFVPEFVKEWFGNKKPSDALIRAKERAQAREREFFPHGRPSSTHQTVQDNSLKDLNFARSSEVPAGFERTLGTDSTNTHTPSIRATPSKSKFDTKTLILAVSFLVNAGLAGVLYGKSTVDDENKSLKEKVSALQAENAKISRSAEGKITLAPNQRVVSVEQIESLVSSSGAVLETANALSEKVDELEARIAKYEGKKSVTKGRVHHSDMETSQSKPVTANASSSVPSKYRQISQAVQSVLADLPSDVSLHVSRSGESTIVTYSDVFGHSRYFTAERPENAAKLSPDGLRNWANKRYMASLDALSSTTPVVK